MIYPRQDCGDDRNCWISSRRESFISSVRAASASASASAAQAPAVSKDSQKAQDSGNTADPSKGTLQSSTIIELDLSTSIPLTASASETTSFVDTLVVEASSTPLPELSSLPQSGFRPQGMPTQPGQWPSFAGGPWRPEFTSSAAATSVTDLPASSGSSLSAKESTSGTKKTALIAGVVVPIILILAGGLLLLACVRRRRRAALATSPTTAPGLLEKVFHKRLDSDATMVAPMTTIHEASRTTTPQRLPNPHLMIPSSRNPTQNPTYFTGLDTFSMHSAATTEDPPPPYRAQSVLSHRSNEPTHITSLTPVSPISPLTPQQEQRDFLSPFSDTHAVPPAAVTRTSSTRSFASTLYSSDASVYEARPARRSVGNACLVPGGSGVSPFDDPEDGNDAEEEQRRS